MDDPPRISTRNLLVHVLGALEAIEAEQRRHRQAFEEHSRSVSRHRLLMLLSAILEWRVTIFAAGVSVFGWMKFWRK